MDINGILLHTRGRHHSKSIVSQSQKHQNQGYETTNHKNTPWLTGCNNYQYRNPLVFPVLQRLCLSPAHHECTQPTKVPTMNESRLLL